MADTGDLSEKHAWRLKQVLEAESTEGDREAIVEFHDSRRSEGKETTTLTTDLSTLRCTSERASVPLLEMRKSDVFDLFTLLTTARSDGGYGLTADGGGVYNYKRVLGLFFEIVVAGRPRRLRRVSVLGRH
ncbi:hypothetical protein ACFQPA_01750 [Halomarina halobia]|uniref:Uncharacterized protein n=1 Tax=Halomarina halobia TaxID=3033386 RepID=A0ABD6A7K8_9EURY|nr:hypothetical protein [Halomarina sp. PSR21]